MRAGIGDSDARLIKAWPGLQFDNTRDYINWGFSAATIKFPGEVMSRSAEHLRELVLRMSSSWDPRFRELVRRTDLSTCFPIRIGTSVPVPAWPASTVTLLGDAIHTMTPGRGVGANTALRDAVGVARALLDVRDGRATMVDAVAGYEDRMRGYAWDAVRKSLRQMRGTDPIHRPVIGRAVLGAKRLGMAIVDRVPVLKRKFAAAQSGFRGADRDPAEFQLDLRSRIDRPADAPG
ncbi:MAG: FAD-dependent monooxygenase [Actinomycetota bacterium]|nr:FAD-dependent monooxygenase [Actinomycetota bacterium]